MDESLLLNLLPYNSTTSLDSAFFSKKHFFHFGFIISPSLSDIQHL